MLRLFTILCASSLGVLAQSPYDSSQDTGRYTFVAQSKPDSVSVGSDTLRVGYKFTTLEALRNKADAYGFNISEIGSGFFELTFNQHVIASILPPVVDEWGNIFTIDATDQDSIRVLASNVDDLKQLTIRPTHPQRSEAYILMSALPWIIPSLMYLDQPDEVFLRGLFFAYSYIPIALASSGLYLPNSDLVYSDEKDFNITSHYRTDLGLSLGYIPNRMFKYYRSENDFRLVPAVGINAKLIHNRSPAQFSLGMYYATSQIDLAASDESGSTRNKRSERLLVNSGMVYPIVASDRLKLAIETGISATYQSISAPYFRINWSPHIGGQTRVSFSHHLLLSTGIDDYNRPLISGWPLLHTLNVSILNPTLYKLKTEQETQWRLGLGLNRIPRAYDREDQSPEILPCISLSKQMEAGSLITIESGVGLEKTYLEHSQSDWQRESIETTYQLFFTNFRLERAYDADGLAIMYGTAFRYLIEFQDRTEERYRYDTDQTRIWYEERDYPQMSLLFSLSLRQTIMNDLSINLGVDFDSFGLLEMILDEEEILSRVVTPKLGIELDLTQWMEGD